MVAWILQHFPSIHGWGPVPGYTQQMPRAAAFVLLRGNQAPEPHRLYLDQMAPEDVLYNAYALHRVMRQFDEACLFSGWLACNSTDTARYLPERVLCQFDFVQTIPKMPHESAPMGLTGREIRARYADIQTYLLSTMDQSAERLECGCRVHYLVLSGVTSIDDAPC